MKKRFENFTRQANFEILSIHPDRVVIRDQGPWNECLTVTNDAENVVKRLVRGFGGLRLHDRRLFYIDSEGSMDEILIKDVKFAGFAPGPGKSFS